MKITDIITENQVTEVSKDDSERARAVPVIGSLIDRLRKDQYQNITADDIRQMKQLVTVTGRARGIYSPATYDDLGKAGSLLDMLVNRYREAQMRSGQMPEFQGRAATAKDMARQIAQQTRGRYDFNLPRTWTTGRGQRYRDPQDYVVYPDQESYDDAWQWVESRGQKVYYRDSFDSLNTAIKIGRYMVEPASVTRGAFSSNPETEHKLSVRGAAAINQSVRSQVDITDQQAAALKDISATRNATAMELLQAMSAVLQGEQDVKRVLDNSKKIDARDKAKLDAIIAAAGKSQET